MEKYVNDVDIHQPITGLYTLKVAQDWLKKIRKKEKEF